MSSVHEEWRDVKGYEGRYQVSSLGRVRSLWCRGPRRVPRIVKDRENNCGYRWVGLSKDGRQKMRFVHRLVCEAFCGGIGDGMQVDHINSDRSDNRAGNLEAVTAKTNTRRCYDRLGKSHGRVVLGRDHIPGIRRSLAAGASERKVAAAYGVSRGAIRRIKDRTTWGHIE